MARIADSEVERLKSEVSLVRLVESSGVVLQRRGQEMVGRCPFHADDTPSLSVNAAKNLSAASAAMRAAGRSTG